MKLPSTKVMLLSAAGIALAARTFIPETPDASAARQRQAVARQAEQQRRSAYIAAHRAIEPRLKSPGTAAWSSYGDTTITEGDGGQLVVSGWVDSHNSFGATVRTKYIVTLEPHGEQWRLVAVKTS